MDFKLVGMYEYYTRDYHLIYIIDITNIISLFRFSIF